MPPENGPGSRDERPLAGFRVLVTRPREQAAELVHELEAAGAEAVTLPTIVIVDPPDWQPADRAIAELDGYDWLLLTSINGVERFVGRLSGHHGLNPKKALAHLETVCVGPKTAAAAARAGIRCQTVAKEYAAEGVIELFSGELFSDRRLAGEKILFPRALKARELLPETLRDRGAAIDVVPVYQTIFPPESTTRLARLLEESPPDLITLTSASTATNLVRHCPADLRQKLFRIPTVCIGPITAEAARKAGLEVIATASRYTAEGLMETLLNTHLPRKTP